MFSLSVLIAKINYRGTLCVIESSFIVAKNETFERSIKALRLDCLILFLLFVNICGCFINFISNIARTVYVELHANCQRIPNQESKFHWNFWNMNIARTVYVELHVNCQRIPNQESKLHWNFWNMNIACLNSKIHMTIQTIGKMKSHPHYGTSKQEN